MTIVCLVVALWGIKFDQVKASFSRANYATLPIFIACTFLFYWVKAIRWKCLLQPMREFRTKEVFPPLMIGFMGNNVLPAHLGEFVRVYVLGQQYRLSKTAVFSTVVLERIWDVIAILLFFSIGLVLVPGLPENFKTASIFVASATVITILLLVAYVIWTEHFVRSANWLLDRLPLPETLRIVFVKMLDSGAIGFTSMRSAKLTFWIVITSIHQWFLAGVIVYIALQSFDIQVTILEAFIVVGVTAFGVTIPSTPGFFGVIQLCFWLSLRLFDVSKEDAFAASVYYQISQYIPVTLLGLYYLNRFGLRLGDIEKRATEQEEMNMMESTQKNPSDQATS